ncbi:hypothetical protein [Thermococcus henrietii]|uniref:hypothetical protein n=1 Tax=Thermococcus henrietii TaxID=2016361 RepID=UPI0011AB6714|nr:hypothetical protein [Thermococcus henrietii]
MFAVLLGLLMVGVTAGSAAALQIPSKEQPFQCTLNTLNNYQSTLDEQFLVWYSKHSAQLPPLNSKTVQELFARFLRENPNALLLLLEIHQKQVFLVDHYLPLVTPNPVLMQSAGIEPHVLRYIPTSGQEQIKVTIYYLKVHVWRWDVTYGEIDKFNWLYTGSKTQEFYDKWGDITTISGYATAIIGFGTTLIKFPNIVAIAIGGALTAVGITLTYESSEMDKYYESTGWQYIWMVLENDYYYPWVPLYNMASTFTVYGYNAQTGKKYTFLPRIEIPGELGYTNEYIAGVISKVAHDWVNSHGTGWVKVA